MTAMRLYIHHQVWNPMATIQNVNRYPGPIAFVLTGPKESIMKMHPLSPKTSRRLTLAVLTSGCMFTSSVHAAFVAELHDCTAGSTRGGSWIGGYYSPGTITATTHQRNEVFGTQVRLGVSLYVVLEGGTASITKSKMATTPPGVPNNHVSVSISNLGMRINHSASSHWAWDPVTGLRAQGLSLGSNDFYGTNGCRNALAYF